MAVRKRAITEKIQAESVILTPLLVSKRQTIQLLGGSAKLLQHLRKVGKIKPTYGIMGKGRSLYRYKDVEKVVEEMGREEEQVLRSLGRVE